MLHASSSGVPWKVKADGSCYGGAAGLSKSAAAQPLDSADHLSAEVHHWRPEISCHFLHPAKRQGRARAGTVRGSTLACQGCVHASCPVFFFMSTWGAARL